MLYIVDKPDRLNFFALINIYMEEMERRGTEQYPHRLKSEQLWEAEQDFREYLQCFLRQKGSFYALWQAEGCFVSALRVELYGDGYLIAGLETMPQHRGKGYAKQLLKAVLDYMEKEDRLPVYSHVSKQNPVSLAVHAAAGFSEFLPYSVYVDGSVSNNALTLRYK